MSFSLNDFVQLVFSGIALGMLYALLAFGYNITFSTSRTLNFSQGDFLMLGAFVSLTLLGKRFPHWPDWVRSALGDFYKLLPVTPKWAVALVVAAILGGLLAIVLERIAIKPALRTGSDVSWILATISLGIILKNVAEQTWGTDDYPANSPFGKDPWQFNNGAINILPADVVIIIASIIIMAAFELFRRGTMLGKAVTAVASDKDAAALMGINVPRVITFSFIVSCAIASIGGVLVAPLSTVSATMGALLGVKAYAAAIIGGLQSGLGVIAGGLILGLSEQLTARFVSSGYKEIPGFVLLIVILLFKPDGLFGRAAVKKV